MVNVRVWIVALVGCLSLWAGENRVAAAIGIGERVKAVDAVNVRQAPAGTYLTTRRVGDQGVVVDGPVVAKLNGFVLSWLRVDFDTGTDGWVAEIGMASLSVIPGTPTNASPGAAESPGVLLPAGPLTLTWAAVREAISYDVRALDAVTGDVVMRTNTTALSFTVTPPPGRQLRWVVAACNPTGCSADGAGLFFQTPPAIPTPDGDNASFVSQVVPTFLVQGQTNVITVVMSNFGTTTWRTNDTYFLAAINPADNLNWGLNRVALAAEVPPGTNATFNFAITAPLTPGTYELQWQMIREGVSGFGQATRSASVVVFPPAVAGDAAMFVSQVVPSMMPTGTTARASITLRNTGTNTWSEAARYRLGSVTPFDNRTWGLNRIYLPASVAPGGTVTFSFPITAPVTPGAYDFQWQMVREGVSHFGDLNAGAPISVLDVGTEGNAAAFIAQTLPAEIPAGTTAPASLTFRNVGTNAWSEASLYRLASVNPFDNLTWGFNRVALPGEVAPGATVTVNFTITAPLTPGAYNFQMQMIREGVGTFGQVSSNASITITAPPLRGNAAAFVSQIVPVQMTPGSVGVAAITLRNTGTNTWSETGKYRLGSINPIDNFTWGGARVLLTNDVAPGELYTFAFSIRAPVDVGSYDFQWMMVQEGIERFTEPTTNVVILVAGEPDVPPQFTGQPTDTTVFEGQPATFTATATGSPAPLLQWQVRPAGALDFGDILGATTVIFTTPALTLADTGAQFRCVATNAAGVALSTTATVTVLSASPSFVLQPTNQTARVGQTASFTVAVAAALTGAPPPTLQWQRLAAGGGTFDDLPGATAETYTTLELTPADDGAQFRCVATNPFGSAVSGVATLTVTNPTVPFVVSISPTNSARNVAVTTLVTVTFSEPMDPATLTASTFTLRRRNQTTNLAATVTYDPATLTATLRPAVPLKTDWTYFVAVLGGGETGVKSLAGVPLARTNVTFSTTDTLPPKFSAVTVKDITATSATITWTANENANRQVFYGLTTDYPFATRVSTVKKRGHTVILTKLLPGTLYHFQIRGTDEAGNTGVSGDFTFTTLP